MMNIENGAREVQEQVDFEEVLNLNNCRLVQYTVLITINNKLAFEHLDEEIRLLNTCSIQQLKCVRVSSTKYSIPGLPGARFLEHQIWPIWYIVRCWI